MKPNQLFTKRNPAGLLVGSALFLATTVAQAQNYSIDWFTLGAGGAATTGGNFALSGTLGQLDASPNSSAGGNFSLTGGFWSVTPVQTPDAPFLSVEAQGGKVRVLWPLPATGFVLDQSPKVDGPWSTIAFPYVTNATTISLNVPGATGNRFYRLRKP